MFKAIRKLFGSLLGAAMCVAIVGALLKVDISQGDGYIKIYYDRLLESIDWLVKLYGRNVN